MNIHLSRAALAALAVEALVVSGVAVVFAKQPVSATHQQQVVMLTFPAPPVAKPEPPKPKPTPPPKPVHHVVHRPPPKPVQQPRLAQTAPTSQPVAVPLPAPVPKPPAPAPDSAPNVSDVFRSAVRDAVQAAVHYPYAARMAHVTGKAQVSFSYIDGRVSNPAILVSSGYRMLDQAALAAVNTAAYPPPPRDLAGKPLVFLVWVRFYQFGDNQ